MFARECPTCERLWARIESLERQLETERAENRRAERHASNMMLRRADSLPLPEPKPPQVEQEAPKSPAIDAGVIAQGRAVRSEGERMGLGRNEIDQALQNTVGITLIQLEQST